MMTALDMLAAFVGGLLGVAAYYKVPELWERLRWAGTWECWNPRCRMYVYERWAKSCPHCGLPRGSRGTP